MEEKEKACGASASQGGLVSRSGTRQSNMELLRLLSMLFVLMLHANYKSIGVPTQADLVDAPFSAGLRAFFEHLTIVAVNVFVLISGWFGIRPKWKGLASLLFQSLFLPVVVLVVCLALGDNVPLKDVPKSFCPGAAYWFVTAYMGLYILSPILNSFADHSTKRQLRLFLVGFFTMELLYGLVVDWGHFIGGYSMLSFVGLYLLAQYVRRYPGRWQEHGGAFFLGLYVLTMLVSTFLFLLLLSLGRSEGRFISYLSPFVLLGSLFLMLAFSRFRLQSRAINWMAASCFSIYLVHCSPAFFPYFKEFFAGLYAQFSGMAYLLLALLCLLCLGLGCILADQVRIFVWKRLLPVLDKIVPPLLRRA